MKGQIMASKLDEHKEQVGAWLRAGVTKTRIAENLSVDRVTLYHWLRSNYIELKVKHPLETRAEAIAGQVVSGIADRIYHLCSQEMEGIEHEGIWLGNGHHAAQNIHAAVMPVLEPLLKKKIREMVLR